MVDRKRIECTLAAVLRERAEREISTWKRNMFVSPDSSISFDFGSTMYILTLHSCVLCIICEPLGVIHMALLHMIV